MHGGHLLVELPAGFNILLSQLEQHLGALFVTLRQHSIAGFIVSVFFQRDGWVFRINGQWILALVDQLRVVAVQAANNPIGPPAFAAPVPCAYRCRGRCSGCRQ